MARVRFWCSTCACMAPTIDACSSVGHRLNAVGTEVTVEVVVTDRRHDLDVNKFGYMNQIGEMSGRDSKSHELHTRARIEQMRKEDGATKRERRINTKMRDNPRRVGAIPMAQLFALKRQYGQDYMQKAEELMRREGCWWGN